MFAAPLRIRPPCSRGVALIIVLAFIVLLTALVVAFFSRAISDRQISNLGANLVKADALAQGAADTIIGDLKQEIAAGSFVHTPSTQYALANGAAQESNTLFVPKATTMMPYTILAGPAPTPTPSPAPTPVPGLENLIKQSAGGMPFYPDNVKISDSNYDATTYKPSTRAAMGSGTNTAIAPWENSSSKPSLNGRYISLARWNKPLLLPATSATDATPKFDGGGTPFVPPDWVLVSRDGSNPAAWDKKLIDTPNPNAANRASAVVGRFAYNIYDEGGLLDANVAGFPAPSPGPGNSSLPAGATGVPIGATLGTQKTALAYADLTQLTNTAGAQLLTQPQIDALVGWRNNASAKVSGAFPNPAFYDVSRQNYYKSTLLNTTGFLGTTASALTPTGQSDRMFSGRQTLINLMKSIASQVPGSDAAKVLDSLRFLGTFGRDLNQPSFVRVQSVDAKAPGYDKSAPKVLAPSLGGNNAGGDTASGSPYSPPLDNQINPTFLAVRVPATQPQKRFDGTDLLQGEPLVKRRFNLNRLAWLTYKGPSQQNMTDPVVLRTIEALGGDSANPNDPVYLFVQQGTDANIRNYFGLQWSGIGWQYNFHNGGGSGSGSIMKVGRPPSVTTPDNTKYVQDAAREADFFELLKASISAGSIAKASTLPPSGSYLIPHFAAQYETDSRIDDAIMQIGANIIDQFDMDGFPTHISFNDGSRTAAADFYGVEDLPYLYQVHPAVVKLAAPVTTPPAPPVPAGTAPYTNTSTSSSSYYFDGDVMGGTSLFTKVTDTGLGATLLIPELWNPHDWDVSTPEKRDQTLGVAGPTNFRIVARSSATFTGTPDNVNLKAANNGNGITSAGTTADNSNSPGFTSRGFPAAGESRRIDESNSEMTFTINRDAKDPTGPALFREPTLLYRPGHPNGSNLASTALLSGSTSVLGALASGAPPGSLIGGGLVAAVGDPTDVPVVGQSYIGVYLGCVPLIWKNQASTPADNNVYRARYVTLDKTIYSHGVVFSFYLQYQGSNGWMTYDEKHVTIGHKGIGYGKIACPMHQPWAGFLEPMFEGDRYYSVLDPRTGRFGMQVSSITGIADTANGALPNPLYYQVWNYPPYSKLFAISDGYQRWISQEEGVVPSLRDGWGIGVSLQMLDLNTSPIYDLVPNNFPTAMGFYPGNHGNNTIWTYTDKTFSMRPGVFSQNVPYRFWASRINGDAEWIGGDTGNYGNSAVDPQFFADPDGVVRRAMGGWADRPTQGRINPIRSIHSWDNNYAELMGLPMRRAHKISGNPAVLYKTDIFDVSNVSATSQAAPIYQSESRPMVLNRPFRSVAELGYTFSGTPWRNLTFNAPESGDSALLDVFCVNDTDNADGLVAGKVNLNTRQPQVIKAIIAGAYKSESDLTTATASTGVLADAISRRLVARTTGIVPPGVTVSNPPGGTPLPRPLQNVADLVGRWSAPKYAGYNVSGYFPKTNPTFPPYDAASFDGFSADVFNPAYFTDANKKTPNTDAADDPNKPYAVVADKTVGRRREAPIRALASVGQTRVWNLLIDVVAQTGRYPQSATALDKFNVEGEQRYWVHVAIDRFTGNVIDKQIETVNE